MATTTNYNFNLPNSNAPSARADVENIADAITGIDQELKNNADAIDTKINKAGDEMTGQLVLPDATADTHSLNRQTADVRYVLKSGDNLSGNLFVGDETNRTPSLHTPHLSVDGNGYSGHVSLDENSMWLGHNSATRDISFAIDNTEKMKLTREGYLLKPNTPAFYTLTNYSVNQVYNSYGLVDFGSIHTNNGSHFANGRFTAPVSGIYSFNATILFVNNGQSVYGVWRFYKNGTATGAPHHSPYPSTTAHNHYALVSGTANVVLNAGDYVEVWAHTPNGGGVHSSPYSAFSGHLIG